MDMDVVWLILMVLAAPTGGYIGYRLSSGRFAAADDDDGPECGFNPGEMSRAGWEATHGSQPYPIDY
jgi:hypothetical protein